MVRSASRSSFLFERDLFGKPDSTLGSSPRASFFRISSKAVKMKAATARRAAAASRASLGRWGRARSFSALVVDDRRGVDAGRLAVGPVVRRDRGRVAEQFQKVLQQIDRRVARGAIAAARTVGAAAAATARTIAIAAGRLRL